MSLLARSMAEQEPLVRKVWLTDEMINLELIAGKIVSVPLVFYPSLADASKEEQNDFRIFGTVQLFILTE